MPNAAVRRPGVSTGGSVISRLARGSLSTLRLPPRELLTTMRVVVVMTVVEVLIRWVRLPRLSRLLGLRVNLAPAQSDTVMLPLRELPPAGRRQVLCTHRVADAWPFSSGPCLRSALVVGHLLRAHDPALRLGVAGAGDEMHAHAWLEIDDRPLEDVTSFTPFEQTLTEAAG